MTVRRFSFLLLLVTFSICGVSAQNVQQSVTQQNLRNHIEYLASDSLAGRLIGSEGNLCAGEYIANCFSQIGLEELNTTNYYHYFDQPLRISGYRLSTIEGCNIIGILPGTDPKLKDEYVVFGAHYDHLGIDDEVLAGDSIFNGADDNASGVAVLIELARNMAAVRNTLKRTIVFAAFDGEEMGLWGSTEFVNNPPVPIEKIAVMVSMDMVGYYGYSNKLKLEGVGTIKDAMKILPESKTINVRKIGFETSFMGATDTQPFAKECVPTLYVTTGLKSPYHKVGDESQYIDYEGTKDVTDYMTSVALTFANYQALAESGKFSPLHHIPEWSFFYGPTAATGVNTTHYSKGALDGKGAWYYNVGVMAQGVYRGMLELDVALQFEHIGARNATQAGTPNKTALGNLNNLTFYSLGVPVSLKVNVPNMSKSPVGAYVALLGYYRYHLSGRVGDYGNKMDFTNQFNRSESGIGFGFGLHAGSFRLGYEARYGISDILRHSYNSSWNMRNHTHLVTFGYCF